MNHRTITALLPMKGHSERVKDKNFRQICGKPLYCWMLDRLLSIESIGKVVINTDVKRKLVDDGITDSKKLLIRDRKPHICGDDVSMNLIIQDDIDAVQSDIYLMTHTTNPLLSSETIENAIETYVKALEEKRADSLLSVSRFQSRFYDGNARPVNHDPGKLVKTQDLEPLFEENSNLYLFSRDSFYETGSRIGKNPLLFVTPKKESIDIDDPEDFDMAAILLDAVTGN